MIAQRTNNQLGGVLVICCQGCVNSTRHSAGVNLGYLGGYLRALDGNLPCTLGCAWGDVSISAGPLSVVGSSIVAVTRFGRGGSWPGDLGTLWKQWGINHYGTVVYVKPSGLFGPAGNLGRIAGVWLMVIFSASWWSAYICVLPVRLRGHAGDGLRRVVVKLCAKIIARSVEDTTYMMMEEVN